jgi:hypothetical protein
MASKMTYQWGRKVHAVDPQTVGETVERIAGYEGYCSPGRLVNEARPEFSPLHPLFTWDDQEAATLWRTHQARQVINGLTVTVKIGDEKVQSPAFFSVGHTVETQDAGEGYRPVSVVVADPDLAREALEEALGRLRAIQRRYDALEALTPVWKALDGVTV